MIWFFIGFAYVYLIFAFTIAAKRSTPDNLKLPIDIYLYFPLTEKNYSYFFSIQVFASIFFINALVASGMFFDGILLRMELQFDILANRVNEFFKISEYSVNNRFNRLNKEIILARNNLVKHHQTIYE